MTNSNFLHMCCYRRFLIVFILVLGGLTAFESNAQLLVGPRFGAQMGWVSLNRDVDKGFLNSPMTPGFYGGAAMMMRVRERFYLHSELLYAQNRQRITGEFDKQLESELTNHMIELPISFKVNFESQIKNLKWQMFLGAGPNIKYWISGTSNLFSSELDEKGSGPMDYKVEYAELPADDVQPDRLYVEDANRIQLGVNAVFGFLFEPQAGNTIIVDFRFDYGHSFQARKDYGFYPDLIDYSEPMRSRFHAFKVGVAYLIDTNVASRNKGKSTLKVK